MQVDREEFMATLQRVKPALGSGGLVPALTHVWFDTKAIYAYDGGFGIKLDHKSELNCGVPGSPLLALLGTSALKDVALEPDKTALKVKMGKAQTKLAMLDGDQRVWNFPLKPPKTAKAMVLDEDFIEGLRKTLFIKASPPTCVEHYGVIITKTKNDLELFSTDSLTMASVRLEGAGKGVDFERTLLPRGFVDEIVTQAAGGAKLYILKDCLIAEAEGVSLFSNLLDTSTAKDMGSIVAEHTEQHPQPVELPSGLGAALSRAEILAGPNDADIVLEVKNNGLIVTGDYTMGTVREDLELEGKHPAAKGRYNAALLRRALPYADTLSLTEGSLLLRGEPGFSYLVGSL